MSRRSPSRKLRRFFRSPEGQCWVWGVAMLAATLLARADGEIHRMNDLMWARMHWAPLHEALVQDISNSYDAPVTGIDSSIPLIDMSQWSKQRIDDYHRSMQARTDPPIAILQMSSVK